MSYELSRITNPSGNTKERFGHSTSQWNNLLAIGRPGSPANFPGNSRIGAVFLYRIESNGTTTLLQTIDDPTGTSASFGYSVSLVGDTLAVGAPGSDPNNQANAGLVYLYKIEKDILLKHFIFLSNFCYLQRYFP